MREKLKNGWHRKLVSAGLAVSLALVSVGTCTKPADAWGSPTHKQTASDGILALGNVFGNDVKGIYYEDGMAQTIMNYSMKPDLDEDTTAHYYSPTTGTNYKGDKINTAVTKATTHYKNSVTTYPNDKNLSGQEFGRLIHYIGDLGQPHHSTNIPIINPFKNSNELAHLKFEQYIDATRLNYAKTDMPKDVLLYVINNDVETIAKDLAYYSSLSAWIVTPKFIVTKSPKNDSANMKMAATNVLPHTEQIINALYVKFLVDVGRVTVDNNGNISVVTTK